MNAMRLPRAFTLTACIASTAGLWPACLARTTDESADASDAASSEPRDVRDVIAPPVDAAPPDDIVDPPIDASPLDAGPPPDVTFGDGAPGSCVLPPPACAVRPVWPRSNSRVPTARPEFRWSGPSGATRVTVCSDRECSHVLQTIDATGSFARATADLPRGVVYWHVSDATCASSTWEFTVTPHATPSDRSWGVVPDVNGDGYADATAVTQVGSTSGLRVYLGSPSGYDESHRQDVVAPIDPAAYVFGMSLAAADVNGDGFTDVVTTQLYSIGYVFFGSASGLSPMAVAQFRGPGGATREGRFGLSVAAAGDVDNDGYEDVLIGGSNHLQTVYLYFGGPDGLCTTRFQSITSDSGLGVQLVGATDFDGDGESDVAIAYAGGAMIFYGRASGLVAGPLLSAWGAFSSLGAGGDIDGDGYGDLAAVQQSDSAAVWFAGGPALGAARPHSFAGSTASRVASAGDVNADGFDDTLWLGPLGTDGSASVSIAMGRASGPMTVATITPAAAGIARGRDVDGDGFDDVLVRGATWTLRRGSADGVGALVSMFGSDGSLTAPLE